MSAIPTLAKFVAARRPASYSFWSENQESGDTDPCTLHLCFQRLLTGENPNVVYLIGQDGSMRLDRVEDVRITEDETPLGAVIRVRCARPGKDGGAVGYSLIAS